MISYKEKYFDDLETSVLPHWNRLIENDGWIDGEVFTQYGIVACYSADLTVMNFAINGTLYSRRWQYGFCKRKLVTLAKRFAKDIYTELGLV